MKKPEKPFRFTDRGEWRVWLEANHMGEKEAWLIIRRAGSGRPGVSYEEAVEEALCFGWIDGLMLRRDEAAYFLRFSPRKRGSIWSVTNQERVARLIAGKGMTEAGLAKIREAKENGAWEAAVKREETSQLPDDLNAALSENALARENFLKFPPSRKRQFLYWISNAKREDTRRSRIHKTVEMAEKNEGLGT